MKWDEAIELASLIRSRTACWVGDISGSGAIVGEEDHYALHILKAPSVYLRVTEYTPFAQLQERMAQAENGYTWPPQAQSAEQFREEVVKAYINRQVRCQCGASDEDDAYLLPTHHAYACPFEWLHRAGKLAQPAAQSES